MIRCITLLAALAADVALAAPDPVDPLNVPDFTWDIAMSVGGGQMPFDAPPWVGFGLRGNWGAHFGKVRIGPGLAVFKEGPVGIHWSTAIEPSFNVDALVARNLLLGIGVAPGVVLEHHPRARPEFRRDANFAPVVAARIGFSQPFTVWGWRVFCAVEPKVRIVAGIPQFVGAIVIGSGGGYTRRER